jgi:hypothetical protein
LVPVRKQPGLKAGAFSPALLVPVATTGINGLYKPGLKSFFPPVKTEFESTCKRDIQVENALRGLDTSNKTAKWNFLVGPATFYLILNLCSSSTSRMPGAGPCVFMGMQVNTQKYCKSFQII